LAPGTNGLVYDIGLNDGTDTAVYLQQNFSVVAVDANPFMVAKASGAFLGDVLKGRLRLLNVGLVDDARLEHGTGMGPQMDFYVHKTHDDWSSFRKEWGCRPTLNLTSMEDLCQVIPVPTTSCGTLVQSLGRAHFMKIDIEGYDMECIQSVALLGRAYLPDYVSVEGPDARKIEAFVLLGYSRFKIQSMQRVLGSFYRENNVTAMGVGGGSGPWGEQAVDIELGRAWRSQSSALAALGRLSGAGGDWYDLHVAF
jgi:FkbM family methyltransferase